MDQAPNPLEMRVTAAIAEAAGSASVAGKAVRLMGRAAEGYAVAAPCASAGGTDAGAAARRAAHIFASIDHNQLFSTCTVAV